MRIVVASSASGDGDVASLVRDLVAAEHDVVVVGTMDQGGEVHRIEVPVLDVSVSPGFLASGYALAQALRPLSFDALIVSGHGGLGFVPGRLRQLGLAFRDALIIVLADARSLDRQRQAFMKKSEIGMVVVERLAFELSDAVVAAEPRVATWLARQQWSIPRLLSLRDGTSTRDVLDAALATRRNTPRSVQGALPPVSVVIPHFEQPVLLSQCLLGFADQDYPHLELVVVDDGSPTRPTQDALQDLGRRSWPFELRILRQRNGGAHTARNAGTSAARTDLVLFFDHDDVPYPDLVKTLARARANSGADVVGAGARTFRGLGAPVRRAGDTVALKLGQPYEMGILSNQYGGPVCLWSRALLEAIGGFRDARVLMGDWEILARATSQGARVLAVPDALYSYRLVPGGLANTDADAKRAATVAAVASMMAETLPSNLRLLPTLAAGAYTELERQRSQPGGRLRVPVARLRNSLYRRGRRSP